MRDLWRRASISDRILLGYLAVIAAGFCVLSVFGVTQSSLGIGNLQVDGQTSDDVLVGQPRHIRGDEFSRSSPLVLGQAAVCSADFTSPLSEDPTVTAATVNSGWAEHVVFFDRTLIQVSCGLPDQIQFAGYWWLWILLAAAGLPLLLRLWAVPLPLIAFATLGSILAPSNMWWSFSPMQPVALASAVACAIGLAGRGTGRIRIFGGVLAVAVGTVALARLPFAYFPFAFPLALSIILPMFAAAVANPRTRRAAIVVSVSILVCGAALALAVLAENRAALDALTNTVYPGDRRESGQLQNLGFVFGAPFLGELQFLPSELQGTNQSEISTAWSIAIVPVLIIAARSAPIATWLGARAPVFWTLSTVLAAWFSWVLFNWPTQLGQALPLVSSIPPDRVAAVIGIPAVLLLAVVLAPRWAPDAADARPSPVGPGIVVPATAVLLVAGSSLQNSYMPFLGSVTVLGIAVLVALSFAAMGSSYARLRAAGLVVALVGMALTVWRVSPVMVGVGDIRGSEAAAAVVSLAGARDPADGYWAADSWELTTLLVSNGIPTMNGDQWTGPTDLWLVLDPDRTEEAAWNRAASVIGFVWNPSLEGPVISSPQSDLIRIEISPCDPVLAELGVIRIVATAALTAACLGPEAVFEYSAVQRYIYAIDGS